MLSSSHLQLAITIVPISHNVGPILIVWGTTASVVQSSCFPLELLVTPLCLINCYGKPCACKTDAKGIWPRVVILRPRNDTVLMQQHNMQKWLLFKKYILSLSQITGLIDSSETAKPITVKYENSSAKEEILPHDIISLSGWCRMQQDESTQHHTYCLFKLSMKGLV